MASLKIIPTFVKFFYLRNILNAKINLSINSIVFFILSTLFLINIFLNLTAIWIVCILLFFIYLVIDILNFYIEKQ